MIPFALLVSLGLAVVLPLASLALLRDWPMRLPLALGIWGASHAAYLAAAWPAMSRAAAPAARSTRTLVLILALGLVPRLALLPTAPPLSEDLYRYLWDGRLVAEGVNPFPWPPADPSLSRFHDELYTLVHHTEVPTVYPPAAQLLFAAAALAGTTPLAWKAVLFLLEGMLVAALVALLTRRRLPPERLLLYYWNPLVVVECYGNGHVDLAVAAFLVLAIALVEGGRRAAAGIAFGAAILTKLLPALLVPALLRRRDWRLLAAAGLFAGLLYVPFLAAGSSLGEGLRVYARHWEFNGPLYTLLRPLFRNGDAPRVVLASCLAAATIVIALRARTLSGAALATWIAFVVCSPTVYPWYLVPAAALLPLHPDAGILALTGTAALTYLPLAAYRAGGPWMLPSWIPAVEYGAMIAAWILAGAYRRAACATESSPT